MVLELEVGFLFGAVKVGEIRVDQLPIIFQGKYPHGHIFWEPEWTELTAIDPDDCMVLI